MGREVQGGDGGKVVGVTSNQRMGGYRCSSSIRTPCPQQSAPRPHPPTSPPGLCCVSKKKKRVGGGGGATSAVSWDPLPPNTQTHTRARTHIKAASFSPNVNIKSVDHKSQHSLHKLPLPQPLILPSDEGKSEGGGSRCEEEAEVEGEGDGEIERAWEGWRWREI